ncbi:TIGR03032 family protein [Rubripirellula amarantea]|nr:TIGR03032 family protein [Rubripirellula amarantea]
MPDLQSRELEIRYEASDQFVPILQHLNATLLVSTYKLGRVAVLQPGVSSSGNGKLSVQFRAFPQAMGIAVSPDRLAIGTSRSVWQFERPRGVAIPDREGRLSKVAYLPRRQRITGNISIHEMAWQNDELWAVNTLFSCLCTFDDSHNFVPRWKPRFISQLRPEDRCHLNGLAMGPSGPTYVSALGQGDHQGSWRDDKLNGGCLLDVASSEVVLAGLAMPHSPRIHDGHLWYLHSGHGEINRVDLQSGQSETIERVPGYTRGLSFAGQFAFVGMSQIRETNVFGGLPIGQNPDALRCGVAVVDLVSGRSVAWFQFKCDVEEVFAVEVVPNSTPLVLHSPTLEDDDKEVWVVPPLPS